MADDQSFRVGQKAFIERDGEILVLFCDGTELDLPGGKIQEGETDVVAALRREVREETALEIEVGRPFATWLNDRASIYLVGYACRYVSGDVAVSDEHDGFRWVNATDYIELNDASPQFAALRECFKMMGPAAGPVMGWTFPEAGAIFDVDATIEANARARAELIAAVDGLSVAQRDAVWFGEWSLCDIVAHLVGAQEGYAEWLEHVARGEPPKITGWEEPGPPDAFNRITVEARSFSHVAKRRPSRSRSAGPSRRG